MTVEVINSERFDQLRQQMLCLDIRSEADHQAQSIAGSCLVQPEQLDQVSAQQVLVYCQGGMRTGMHEAQWNAIADKEIYILEGGLNRWNSEGKETVGEASGTLPLQRQVFLSAGVLLLLFSLLVLAVSPAFAYATLFIGGGLTLAGATGFCGMARVLALAPWNK
ncbi:Inner membrane protein YgaP [Sinobacterium norvegicum]|uniref:Inner membrane protein YgaP n=1 Tax=Sinobacterium norvegicum TaxID=1641715 RepID=A0ABM9AH74_9GAMM|nr:rhodanese family protein [Sinobacterium norvegicum]CAH0992334.1 Inner membrane protein YgaP [Sinobacterium norvegicum]